MGLGSLCLAVVLAQARVPVDGGHLPIRYGQGYWGIGGRGGELPRQSEEFAPARRGRRARDTAYVPQDRMELFSGAACDFWSECHNGSLIPLPRPSASHKGRMVWDDEEGLEFAPEFQHRPWREAVNSDGEV